MPVQIVQGLRSFGWSVEMSSVTFLTEESQRGKFYACSWVPVVSKVWRALHQEMYSMNKF